MPRKYILWAMKTKVSLFYSNQLSDCKVTPSYLKKMQLNTSQNFEFQKIQKPTKSACNRSKLNI